jgi:hypothetical protein
MFFAHNEKTWYFCFCENFDFQCRSHKEHIISSYRTYSYVHLGITKVEQFMIFMAAYELKSFIDDIYKATIVTH